MLAICCIRFRWGGNNGFSLCCNLPTAPGLVNGHNVHVMRYLGCSGGVLKNKFVEAHQYTGQYRLCLLIDGTVRKVSVAKGLIDSAYFIWDVDAMLMDTPVYDVIIRNAAGSRNNRGLCLCGRMVNTLSTRSVRHRYDYSQVDYAGDTLSKQSFRFPPRSHITWFVEETSGGRECWR